MKKSSNKTYTLLLIVAICIFIISSVTAFISINSNRKHFAYAYENQEIVVENYDFSDNSVIVTMDKN